MTQITVTTLFEPEDWAWLWREATRREVRVMDIINEIMPPDIEIKERMSEEELAAHMERLMLAAVRKARMGVQ